QGGELDRPGRDAGRAVGRSRGRPGDHPQLPLPQHGAKVPPGVHHHAAAHLPPHRSGRFAIGFDPPPRPLLLICRPAAFQLSVATRSDRSTRSLRSDSASRWTGSWRRRAGRWPVAAIDPPRSFAEWIRAVNASGQRVVAVDVPSGLDADTGVAYSPTVRADVTVTLGLPKPGLLTSDGPRLAGEVWAVDIGVPFEAYAAAGVEVP